MLSRCVSVDADTFHREIWSRRPLLSGASDLPRDFTDLLSSSGVDELLSERGVRAPFIRMAKSGNLIGRECFVGPAGVGAEIGDQVDSAKVLAQFADGATIVMQGLHRLWPPIIDFVRSLTDDLGHPVQANAYITPPGNQGFDPHYDVHDVFVLQIAGTKRWTVHEPVFNHPLAAHPWTDHRDAIAERAQGDPAIDTDLTPGDALYLPRGWLHSARATDHTAIHLTIGVPALTRADAIRTALDRMAAGVDDLRASLPAGVTADRDVIEAEVATALTMFADEVRDRTHAWASMIAAELVDEFARRTRPAAVRPLASLDAIASGETAVVRWRRGLIGTVVADADRVYLRFVDRTIGFPSFCGDALRRIQCGDPVGASDLPGVDATDGAVIIRRLLREAVVVPAPR